MSELELFQVTITYLCREADEEESYTQFLSRINRIREFFPHAIVMYSSEPEYIGGDGSDDLYTQLGIERYGVVDEWELYCLHYVVRMTAGLLDKYSDMFFLDPPEGRDAFPAFLMKERFAFVLDSVIFPEVDGDGMVAPPPPFGDHNDIYY